MNEKQLQGMQKRTAGVLMSKFRHVQTVKNRILILVATTRTRTIQTLIFLINLAQILLVTYLKTLYVQIFSAHLFMDRTAIYP